MPLRITLVLLLAAGSAAAQTPADTLEFSETAPEIVGGLAALQQRITYPAADRDAGRQGTVIIRFVVTATGEAAAVEVARSVSPGLDAAAAEAVRLTRFVPGTQRGLPVNVRMTVPIRFTLRDDAPAAPGRASFDTEALLTRLGQPWSTRTRGLPAADSVGTADGARSLYVWHAVQPGVERVEAAVTRDTLRLVSIRFAPEADSLLADLARQLAAARPLAQPDSFALARDLAAGGIQARADLRVDPVRRTLTYRQPLCREVPGAGCVSDFPTLVGGLQRLTDGVRYPRAALDPVVSGIVVVTLVVQADGTPTNVRVASNTAGRGIGAQALEAEAVRVVRDAHFLPAVRGTTPVAAAMSVPIRFSVR